MRIQRQNESFAWRVAAPRKWASMRTADSMQSYTDKLEEYHKALSKLRVNSQTLYGRKTDDKGYVFDDPTRQKKHELLKELMWSTGGVDNEHLHERGVDSVPGDGRALILAGQAGSGKGTILGHPQFKTHIDTDQFYTSNPDPHKPVAAYLGMVPTQDELDHELRKAGYGEDFISGMPRFSPMDLSPLIHEEISDLNKELVAKALKQNKNIIFDGTFASAKSALTTLGQIHKNNYNDTTGLMVDAPMEFSLPRADDRYARGHQNWLEGGEEYGFHREGSPALIRKLRELTAHYGLDDELTQRYGEHYYMPAQGGRYVPKFVSKKNESTDGFSNSASSQNFLLLHPLMKNFVVTDARRNLKNADGEYIAVPRVVAGRGSVFDRIQQGLQGVPAGIVDPNEPPYEKDWSRSPANPAELPQAIDKIMADPKNKEPRSLYEGLPRYALRRFAALDQELARLQEKYTDSYEHIVDRFEAGEFEFDVLLQLLFARAQYRREVNEEDDQSLEAAYARSEEFDSDDWRHALNGALHGGFLTKEQKSMAQQAIEDGYHGFDPMV